MSEVGFTGTQEGCTPDQRAALTIWLRRFHTRGAEWLHNGDCVGADKDAGNIWVGLGGKLHLHPPENAAKRAWQSCDAMERPLPYLARNRVIVDRSAVLVATPKARIEELRSGTWSTVRYARTLGRPILIIYPDGEGTQENWERRAAA